MTHPLIHELRKKIIATEDEAVIVRDITNQQYHDGIGLSRSRLGLWSLSPHAFVNGSNIDPLADYFCVGTALHTSVLEPDRWTDEVAIWDGDTKTRGVKFRKWASTLPANVCPITPTEADLVSKMSRSVLLQPDAAKLLRQVHDRELSIWWTDESTNLRLKCRLDAITADAFIDIKTTGKSSGPRDFEKALANHGYHRQAAYYMEGAIQAGLQPRDWYFIVVSKEDAQVGVYKLSEQAIKLGRKQNREALDGVARFLDQGTYDPYYGHGMREIDLPRWFYRQEG